MTSQNYDSLLLLLRFIGVAAAVYYGYRKQSLTTWIFVSMVVGVFIGYDFPVVGIQMKVVSKIFLRLIKSIIAPLLFATLATGIAAHGNAKQVGRLGLKALIYFEVVTTLALFIGLLAINITKVGVGIQLPPTPPEAGVELVKPQSWEEIILHIFPENIAKATAEGQILQVVVFSILFGIGLSLVQGKAKTTMLSALEALSEVMFKFTQVVMYFAPVAVGAAIAYTVAHMGLGILVNLFSLLLTLYGALAFFVVVVLLPIALVSKLPIRRFISEISEPVALAFATTSSEAALPKAMRAMERLGVPRNVVAFVMPAGYSFNLDGTTLYLALASVFVAQAAGIAMPIEKQLLMVFTLMVTSKGVAGVPRASLVILMGTAATFGLPVEPIFIILGIDELMDMARTSINVVGNCLATWVVGRWNGDINLNTLPIAHEE